MKDAEDEAFDELAKRQGAWGGGYQAKRQMAMDKLQEPAQEQDWKTLPPKDAPLVQWVKEQTAPPQRPWVGLTEEERVSFDAANPKTREEWDELFDGIALAQPVQEPVARVTGVYGGRFTYEPINPAMILPIGMALYAAPKGNT